MGGTYEPGVNPEAFASVHLGREHGMFVGGGCVVGVWRSDVVVGCGKYRVMLSWVCSAVVVGAVLCSCCGWGFVWVAVFCCCGLLFWVSMGFVVVCWVGL